MTDQQQGEQQGDEQEERQDHEVIKMSVHLPVDVANDPAVRLAAITELFKAFALHKPAAIPATIRCHTHTTTDTWPNRDVVAIVATGHTIPTDLTATPLSTVRAAAFQDALGRGLLLRQGEPMVHHSVIERVVVDSPGWPGWIR